MNNNYMEGYLVFRCNYSEGNLPYRLYAEWSRWYGTVDAGYAMSDFGRSGSQAIESLVSLGVLVVQRENWYFTDFGAQQCVVEYMADLDAAVVYIPLDNDYLPF